LGQRRTRASLAWVYSFPAMTLFDRFSGNE
jgi:hypothetical protein